MIIAFINRSISNTPNFNINLSLIAQFPNGKVFKGKHIHYIQYQKQGDYILHIVSLFLSQT